MFRNPFSSTTIGDENPIRTLGDYSRPSHEGYRNTIELPEGNNVVPLRSDTIRLVQNGCSFHGLRSEDPNQHLKDFLKLVDLLDLDGSISTWEDLTTRFLAHFFLPGRTTKLRNDILMFQQHHGESLSEAWTCFKDLLQKVPHHGIDLWLQAILEDLALYDNESWNDPRYFAKPVKAIALPQDAPSTSDRHLIELKNQVQRLMEAHLALTQPTQVNKITTPYEIYCGTHDIQCCWKTPNKPSLNTHPRVPMKRCNVLEIIRDDEPQNKDPHEVEGATTEEPVVEYFDTFPTRDELTYHRLYLMRRSLEVLRKFHWMILGGRFNQLLHVSSPLLSKPGEY
ncbi:MAK10-like protein [Tanacetum coccineum]|uniref:MAK10-like protein n=1 Tax=Tanacetum coccineum TaxID=301880 RepID=A0ABQ5J5N6_9ASTR